MHRPPLPQEKSLILIFRGWVDIRAHGFVGRKHGKKIPSDTTGNRSRDRPTSSLDKSKTPFHVGKSYRFHTHTNAQTNNDRRSLFYLTNTLPHPAAIPIRGYSDISCFSVPTSCMVFIHRIQRKCSKFWLNILQLVIWSFYCVAAFYTISDTTRNDKRYWSHKKMTLYNISNISVTHSVQSDRHTRDTRQRKWQ